MTVPFSRAIFGCAGLELLPEERDFFRQTRPWGFILLGRNIADPEQVKRLDQASEMLPAYPYWHQRQFKMLNTEPRLYGER